MSKQLLVTKTVGNTQFQLYKVGILYPATYNDYKGTVIEQKVKITAYGIVVVISDGIEEIRYDSGPLSPKNYLVNAIYHLIIREGLTELDQIRLKISLERVEWCRNQYGNPFSKDANQKLRQQFKKKFN